MEVKEKTDNELIAVFMGLKHSHDKAWMWNPLEVGNSSVRVDELRYHDKWDWLMPAMERAKKAIKEAGYGTPTEKQALMKLRMALNEVSNINIKNAHFCLVHFIKWFNSQNKV